MIYCKEYAKKGTWETKDEEGNTVNKCLLYVELVSDEAIDGTIDKATVINFPQEYDFEDIFICPGSICWDATNAALYMANFEEEFILQS